MIGTAGVTAGLISSLVQLKELAREVDGVAGHQPLDDLEALIRASAASAGVDAAYFDLMAVLAAHADTKDHPPGRDRRHGRELASDGKRMPQRQQIDADHHFQRWVELRERSNFNETVGAGPIAKRHVVGHIHLVDPGILDVLEDPLFLVE